jgi:hypothetical protein
MCHTLISFHTDRRQVNFSPIRRGKRGVDRPSRDGEVRKRGAICEAIGPTLVLDERKVRDHRNDYCDRPQVNSSSMPLHRFTDFVPREWILEFLTTTLPSQIRLDFSRTDDVPGLA